MKRYPGPHGTSSKCLSFPVNPAHSPSCYWGYVFSNPMGTGMGSILSESVIRLSVLMLLMILFWFVLLLAPAAS